MKRFALMLAVIVYAFGANSAPPRTRSFHLEYKATIPAAKLEVWIPLPHDDDYQKIESLHVESQFKYDVATGAQGNKMLHMVKPETPEPSAVTVSLAAVRREHLQSRLSSGERLAKDEDAAELAKYLKPDRLVPLDPQIRTWAREVVDSAHAHSDLDHSDLEMIRAIYDHVVATVKYDKTSKGWGRGDIYYACDARRGNCTDFHAIVIGYARSLGIPARFAIGLPLPVDRGAGKIAGYHCWAEVYAKGIGWIPIDASEAAKNPARREYFFGAHDENRLELSKGRDVILTPKQAGEPLNYFVYPYAEMDGKPVENIPLEVSYRDLP
jgi:transglutaminase-like putative cysteine protease